MGGNLRDDRPPSEAAVSLQHQAGQHAYRWKRRDPGEGAVADRSSGRLALEFGKRRKWVRVERHPCPVACPGLAGPCDGSSSHA